MQNWELTCREEFARQLLNATEQERQVLAAELHDIRQPSRTVESHRAHICEKLELTGSNRLLQFALQHRDALSGPF